jgi:putative flippase GtrA
MNIEFIKYKYRFFIGYVIIGFFSLLIELIFYNFLSKYFDNVILNSLCSVLIGILISFWLNIRYNFKISKSKRDRALTYFVIISLLSYLIQIFLIERAQIYFSYELSRIIISGSVFWIAYLLHSKFSFKDYKKVGVAIYANGVEDIPQIFNNISNFPDFIHVDIVDQSINLNAKEVLSYKAEVIKAFWNKKFIEAHIMSKTPKKWILDIIKYVDRIYIHLEIEEDIVETLQFIKES